MMSMMMMMRMMRMTTIINNVQPLVRKHYQPRMTLELDMT